MNISKNKEIWISGFALFSLFFGAGNLILPPSLGVKFSEDWLWVALGFFITAVLIPILGVFAHARVQGTLYDLAKKVSPWFGYLFCALIYIVAITLPAPRTASVTHEMAIQPFFGTSPWLTSSIYFLFTYVFVINRSKILSLIGKFLTPIIGLILFAIILLSIFQLDTEIGRDSSETPLVIGILEGYQTFDAIGGIVVGALIIVSLNLKGYSSYKAKKELITKSGLIAGIGLLLIYGGLIFSGAIVSNRFTQNASRTEILTGLSNFTLGNLGTSFLSILVALACFTTCVGVITGAADYVKGVTNNSKFAYTFTVFVCCVTGIVLGSYSVQFIIDFALPALMFIYPITIILILLNILPEKWASPIVFRTVVLIAFVFSIPDFLQFFMDKQSLVPIQNAIPLSNQSLGWVIPSIVVFLLANIYQFKLNRNAIK